MRLASSSALLAVLLFTAPVARAQSLLSEEVRGNYRLCNYGGDPGLLSGTARGRQHQVGIAENCPLTLPVVDSSRPVPPTAALYSESLSEDGRTCVYERWGSSWTFTLRHQSACPPVAGMITRNRPRATDLPPSPAQPQ